MLDCLVPRLLDVLPPLAIPSITCFPGVVNTIACSDCMLVAAFCLRIKGGQCYSGGRAGITAFAAMSQVPRAVSLENFFFFKDTVLWPTPSEAYVKKEDGRGSGDKLAQHGKNIRGIADFAASLTSEKILEDNLKEDAHIDAILKMLHTKKYEIDFHGYIRLEALKVLEDIIISLKYNMKGKSKQQFTIITGKGNHSRNGKSVIQEAVWDYLRRNDILFEPQKHNSGHANIIVKKAGETEDHC